MHSRVRRVGVTALAVIVLATPTALASVGRGHAAVAADDLDQVRGQLEVASRELADVRADVRAAVERASAEVTAAEERAREASTELHRVEQQLAAAHAAAEQAVTAERDAAATLQAAIDELATLTRRHADGRDRLAEQALVAFKRGGAAAPDLLIGGVVRAADWHEVAVARGVLGRVLVDQRDAVAADAELTRETARANAGVSDARRAAVAAAREASVERRRVEQLVAEQTTLVATLDAQLRARAAVLRDLEADAAARAVLVRDLASRADALQRAAASVRVPVAVLAADGPPPTWAAGLPAAGRPWAATIDAVAASQGLDGRLLAALVWTESAFRPDAVSHAGAMGLAQLMPGTARGLGVDPRDPLQNLAGGARYLSQQLDAFGRVDLALAAYNAGPGRVRQAGNAIPSIVETQLYVVRVLDRYEALRTL